MNPPHSTVDIAAFARLLAQSDLAVSAEIAPGDGMYAGNLEHYLGVGRSALRCIGAAALLAGVPLTCRRSRGCA